MEDYSIATEQINRGIDYMAAKNYEAAATAFQLAAKAQPKQGEIYEHLGNAYASLNRLDDATKAFKTAIMLSPGDGKLYYSLGSIGFLKDDYASAIEYYNKAEAVGFQSADLFLTKAIIFVQEDDVIQAIREISRAIALRPLDGTLYRQKVLMQIGADMLEEAQETLREFQSMLPDALETYDLSIQIYCMKKAYPQAQEVADKALQRFPNDPAIKLLQLRIYVESEQNQMGQAYGAAMLAEELPETVARQTVAYQATLCAKLGMQEQVIQVLSSYTAKHEDAEILYLLMNAYMAAQHFPQMKQTANRLRAMDAPPSIQVSAMYYYADALERTGETVAAMAEYRTLTKQLRKMTLSNPGLYEGYIYRLLSHTKLKEYDKALDLADYLENAHPELGDGSMFRVYIYDEMGELEKAAQEREKVRRLHPDITI